MKFLLTIGIALYSFCCLGQQLHRTVIIRSWDKPANQLMIDIARYYGVKVVFARGFPVTSTSIIGCGEIIPKHFTPSQLARDLSNDKLRVEFHGTYFYVALK